ncbi:4Fe-4S dicluster domain-containing protein [Marinilabiliaceae bacterium JC017]|nr:4Fe-4S dicluster domain-containing protein [Marinilabiliaceae bacterium JC017]
MTYYNNAIFTKRELLVRILKLLKKDSLLEEIDRIPLEMRPRTKAPIRCCVHKDRAVIKYKIMALLGYNISDEEDELTPLREYAAEALLQEKITGNFLTVVDEACSSCVKVNYTVSNLCQGCEGRSCQVNCPKDAIQIINGKAFIDHQKCVNCGLCQKACPFHAIAYLPVPCEESCPVNAISKNEYGVEEIDFDKCIHCGKCMNSCPFGAINEKSQILHIYKQIQTKTPTIALVAPAVLGQFKAEAGKILNAISKLGFADVIEVAQGADITTQHETAEWKEKMEAGETFMTTSCCPAYTELTQKHIKGLIPHVSHTPSPMVFTADVAREKYPNAKLVFIGPCLAKRKEAFLNKSVDYVMTAEELGAFFAVEGIDVTQNEALASSAAITPEGRGFAASGGVTAAIESILPEGTNFKAFMVNGLSKKTIKLLKTFPIRPPKANFVEVMACEGGCISGPGIIAPSQMGQANLRKAIDELKEKAIV